MGGNDTDDDPAAAHMDADVDIDGDASGAAGGSADNNQVPASYLRDLSQGFSVYGLGWSGRCTILNLLDHNGGLRV